MMRSSNPALTDKAFRGFSSADTAGGTMTIQGTVNRTAFLLVLVAVSAVCTWQRFVTSGPAVMPWLWGGMIGGLILSLVTVFKKTWAPVTAPLYAVCEGLALGGISAFYEAKFGGIVFQAVGLTFGTLGALLVAYTSRLIKATENFKLGVFAATGGVALVYLASMVMGFFGVQIPGIFGNGLIGIAFSGIVVVIAALNLVMDFDFIEHGAEQGAPKHMEWYGAFGLLVTLVWLYLEMLRLLSKLRSRD